MGSIRNPKDFWAGLLFVALGVLAFVLGSDYTLGTAARMGPGYFPRMLGLLLIALGMIIVLRGVPAAGRTRAAVEMAADSHRARQRRGLRAHRGESGSAISTVVLIVLASAASHEFRPKEAIIAGVLLAALSVGVFVVGLHLQLPIWPEFSN